MTMIFIVIQSSLSSSFCQNLILQWLSQTVQKLSSSSLSFLYPHQKCLKNQHQKISQNFNKSLGSQTLNEYFKHFKRSKQDNKKFYHSNKLVQFQMTRELLSKRILKLYIQRYKVLCSEDQSLQKIKKGLHLPKICNQQ